MVDSDVTDCDVVDSDHTVFVHGDIDLLNRHELVDAGAELLRLCTGTPLRPAIARTGTRLRSAEAILDVGGLGFIGATGLGVLVTLSADLRRAGVRLRLRHPSARLQRLSTICDLDATLGLMPT